MDAELLVVGAGPYALSVAALAQDCGITTTVLGRQMGFWRENMPARMFLRSGPDWHLDAAGVHTLEAFLEDRGIRQVDVDPVPIDVFLAYADPNTEIVQAVPERDGEAPLHVRLSDSAELTVDRVVFATGYRADLSRVPYLAGIIDEAWWTDVDRLRAVLADQRRPLVRALSAADDEDARTGQVVEPDQVAGSRRSTGGSRRDSPAVPSFAPTRW